MQFAKRWATASTLLIGLGGGASSPLQTAMAEPVTVRYAEGVTHAFLELQTLAGKNVAWGETSQVVRSDRVTSHMVCRFTDGSFYEETTIFIPARHIPAHQRPSDPERAGVQGIDG